jgi:hypothetical protein
VARRVNSKLVFRETVKERIGTIELGGIAKRGKDYKNSPYNKEYPAQEKNVRDTVIISFMNDIGRDDGEDNKAEKVIYN